VADYRRLPDECAQPVDSFSRLRCAVHHVIGDAGEPADELRDRPGRIDECAEFLGQLAVHKARSADLDDCITYGVQPGGFEIDSDEFTTHQVSFADSRNKCSVYHLLNSKETPAGVSLADSQK
jgi:hypothetical protein